MACKRAENTMQANEQLFRSIFDNAQIGISLFSIDGQLAFTNRACQEMLGCSEEELSQLEAWDRLVHPDDQASGQGAMLTSSRGSVTAMNGNNASFGATVALWLPVRGSHCLGMLRETRNTLPHYWKTLQRGSGRKRNETGFRNRWRYCWSRPARAFTESI